MMEIKKILIILFVVLAILVLAYFSIRYLAFLFRAENRFKVENQYYELELKTPKSWQAYEKTFYSEDVIGQLIQECVAESLNKAYKIGDFRFGEKGFNPGSSSEVLLEIKIDCINGNLQYSYSSQSTDINKIISSMVFKDNANK